MHTETESSNSNYNNKYWHIKHIKHISCERVSWITMWLLQQISATAIEFETKFVYTHILFLFTGVVWTNRICVYVKKLTEIIVGEGSMK